MIFTCKLALAVLFAFFIQSLSGQSPMTHGNKFLNNWYVNGNVGVSQFYGDMSVENPLEKLEFDTRIGAGFILGKMLTPTLGVRGEVHYAKLKSTNKNYGPNGTYFIAKNLVDVNLSATVNFVNMIWGFQTRRVVTAYGFIGAGLSSWETVLYDYRTNEKLGGNGHQGNGPLKFTTEFVMPFGGGLNFRLSRHWDIALATDWRMVNSDKLDHREGGNIYDFYTYTSLGFTYKFNLKKKKAEPEAEKIEPDPSQMKEVEESEDIAEPERPTKKPPVEVIKQEQEPGEQARKKEEPAEEVPEIEFRVQIRAAYAKPVSEEELEDFDIPEEIRQEYTDGWYRYTIGSFDNLVDATDYRTLVRNSYKVSDAFVVAYVDGKRLKSLRYLDNEYRPEEFNILDEEFEHVRYGVQIAASYLKPLPVEQLREKYNLDEPVREDIQNGWYRYSVGSFNKYWKAKEYRNILLTRNNAKGSFVVGFRDDERYTILEMLGIGSGQTPEDKISRPKKDVTFRVQLLVLDPEKQISPNALAREYGITQRVEMVMENGLAKYQAGKLDSYEHACALRDRMVEKGIADAFVVPYVNGKRIPISEAFED